MPLRFYSFINLFSKDAINRSKVTIKPFIIQHKNSISMNCCFLTFLFIKESCITVSQRIWAAMISEGCHTEKWKAYTTLKRTVVILGNIKHNIHQVCLIMPFQWCSSAVPHPPGHLLLVWVWTWARNKRARGWWLEGRELQHKDLCHNWGQMEVVNCSFNTIRTPFPSNCLRSITFGHLN